MPNTIPTTTNDISSMPPHSHNGIDSPLLDLSANNLPSTISLTGDITGSSNVVSGTTSIAATIANNAVTEAKIGLSDNTTNDVSTSKHGFVPKAPNDSTKFLNGTGVWNNAAMPYWVDEGGISWSAESSDKSITFANSGRKYYMIMFNFDDFFNLNWRVNGNSSAVYDYAYLPAGPANQSINFSSAQTSIKLIDATAGSSGGIMGTILCAGSSTQGGLSFIMNIATFYNTTSTCLRGDWGPGGGTRNLSSCTFLVNGNTVTGSAHAYSLNV